MMAIIGYLSNPFDGDISNPSIFVYEFSLGYCSSPDGLKNNITQ